MKNKDILETEFKNTTKRILEHIYKDQHCQFTYSGKEPTHYIVDVEYLPSLLNQITSMWMKDKIDSPEDIRNCIERWSDIDYSGEIS